MDIIIRRALPIDLEGIQSLARQVISNRYPTFLGEDAVNMFVGSGASDQYLEQNLPYCWVLCRDNQALAVSVCKENQIELMMVSLEHHRRGLGSELLSYCESMLFLGNEELVLESFAPNAQANHFYAKHGWQERKRYQDTDSGVEKLELCKIRSVA